MSSHHIPAITKMRVLTVIENYNPYIVGGAEVTVETYVKHIIAGYDVHYKVLTGRHTGSDTVIDALHVSRQLIGVQGLPYSVLYQLFAMVYNLIFLLFNLLTYRPNIIEFVPNNYSLYPLIFAATLLRYPLVISVHNNSFAEEIHSIGGWLEAVRRHIIKYLNQSTHTVVITISLFMKRSLIDAGIDKSRMIVFYNPIVRFYPRSKRGKYAVFASRLVKEKGTDVILEAFSAQSEVELHIFGDGELRPLVLNYVRKYPHIKYFGKVSEDDVVKSIRGSSFVVAHPMFEEPFGRYIIHSFSTLKPLISSFSGAVTELIHDHQNGLLVNKGDIEALKMAIIELQSNNTLYERIVKNLKENREKFGIETVAKKRLCILSRRL